MSKGHGGFVQGQLVCMKDNADKKWTCGHVVGVHPLTVASIVGSSAFTWDQVRRPEEFDESELEGVIGWHRTAAGGSKSATPGVEGVRIPPGTPAEDRDNYPRIVARANRRFTTKVALIGALTPVFANMIWLVLMNAVNEGAGKQSFWWYALVFDNYFMIVKGIMFTAFFYAFLPEPDGGHWLSLYAGMAASWPIFNLVVHFIWVATGNVDSDMTWGLMKLNFPVGASVAVFTWIPVFLFVQYGSGERLLAFLRFGVIVVILVADLIFIGSSHAYMLLFTAYKDGDFGVPGSSVAQGFIELVWMVGFSQLYMTFLGKVWEIGLLLFDKLAPLTDLQRQRMLYFATVVLDMHRFMYMREMMLQLKSWPVFLFILSKDFVYDVYHFGIKALPTYEAALLINGRSCSLSKRDGAARGFQSRVLDMGACAMMCWADFLELPKRVAAVFYFKIDAGFPGESSTRRFFFGETVVEISRVPDSFGEELVEWTEKSKRERKWNPDLVAALSFDDAHARDLNDLDVPSWESYWEGFKNVNCADFYQYLTMQLGGVVFARYRARIAIKLASSMMLIVAHPLLKLTPTAEVFNHVRDHSVDRTGKVWVFVVLFFLSDALNWLIVELLQPRDVVSSTFRFRRFGRLFGSNVFTFMVLSCHVCCNSDLFLTFSDLNFGG